MNLSYNICSYNVASLRSIIKKDNFINYFNNKKYDVVCFQETKLNNDSVLDDINQAFTDNKYKYYSNCIVKKGYSGTCIFSKIKPLKHLKEYDDDEGRILCLEYDFHYLINVYAPNAGSDMKRLDFKVKWLNKFFDRIKNLSDKKPIIIVGDLNVAPQNIDLYKPESHHKSPGFTDIERNLYIKKIKYFIDSYRFLYPQKVQYTYFDKRSFSYSRGYRGWRIDHALITPNLINNIEDSIIDDTFYGPSDHVPIILSLKF